MCGTCLGSKVISKKLSFGVIVGPCPDCNQSSSVPLEIKLLSPEEIFTAIRFPEVGEYEYEFSGGSTVPAEGSETRTFGRSPLGKFISEQHIYYGAIERALSLNAAQALLDSAQRGNIDSLHA